MNAKLSFLKNIYVDDDVSIISKENLTTDQKWHFLSTKYYYLSIQLGTQTIELFAQTIIVLFLLGFIAQTIKSIRFEIESWSGGLMHEVAPLKGIV